MCSFPFRNDFVQPYDIYRKRRGQLAAALAEGQTQQQGVEVQLNKAIAFCKVDQTPQASGMPT